MRPERVIAYKWATHRPIREIVIPIIRQINPTYAKSVYRRTLHPSYIPWVQAAFHPIISKKMGIAS